MVVERPIRTTLVALAILALGAACQDRESIELVSYRVPLTWRAEVFDFSQRLTTHPGETWTLDYEVEVDLRNHQPHYGRFTELIVAVLGHPEYDAEGNYKTGPGSLSLSPVFTTTGIPVERDDGWPKLNLLEGRDGSPFEAIQVHPLSPDGIAAVHELEGTLRVAVAPDAPVGYYRPRLLVFVRIEGVEGPVTLENFGQASAKRYEQYLPLVAVGEPATPQLPWSIFADIAYRGQSGVLPRELDGKVALVSRSGFASVPVYRPGQYTIRPNLPSVFPYYAIPVVRGGDEVFFEEVVHYLDLGTGEVTCTVRTPDGETKDLGRQPMRTNWRDNYRMRRYRSAATGEFELDMRQTGTWEITLRGWMNDRYGRRLEGGGTYVVETALPLTFSTSVKPGRPFEVGGQYPAKVNINPPVPATVEVEVDYYPRSDPERVRRWRVEGEASRYGHFVPYDEPPFVFDEPGEYISRVTATYVDVRGKLWRGRQTSSGVVAPLERRIELHGLQMHPLDLTMRGKLENTLKRYADLPDVVSPLFMGQPGIHYSPAVPYHTTDTLFIPSNGFNESLVAPHMSMSVNDEALSRKMREGLRIASVLAPPVQQPLAGPLRFLENVVEVSSDRAAWFPASDEHADQIPVLPVGDGRWHPFAYPEHNRIDAYTYLGVVRPGFPVMTIVMQSDALGLYWIASPNEFGGHFNAGENGDLHGDLYHVQGGVVIKDNETGERYYDGYASTIAVTQTDGSVTSVLGPGERPLTHAGGTPLYVLLAQDTHDAYEVGETMHFGGLVMPAVPAEVTWTVTKPSGDVIVVPGKVARLGPVYGERGVPLDEPGIYRVKGLARWDGHVGHVPGSYDGTFWNCAVPVDAPPLLTTTLGPRTTVDPTEGLLLPLDWPDDLEQATLHWGIIMPGRIFDQGEASPTESRYEFPLRPQQIAVQAPQFDVRNYGSGEWELVDTLVLQFFLEGVRDGRKVYDSLRLVLRRDKLYNYRMLVPPPQKAAAPGHPPAHPGPHAASAADPR